MLGKTSISRGGPGFGRSFYHDGGSYTGSPAARLATYFRGQSMPSNSNIPETVLAHLGIVRRPLVKAASPSMILIDREDHAKMKRVAQELLDTRYNGYLSTQLVPLTEDIAAGRAAFQSLAEIIEIKSRADRLIDAGLPPIYHAEVEGASRGAKYLIAPTGTTVAHNYFSEVDYVIVLISGALARNRIESAIAHRTITGRSPLHKIEVQPAELDDILRFRALVFRDGKIDNAVVEELFQSAMTFDIPNREKLVQYAADIKATAARLGELLVPFAQKYEREYVGYDENNPDVRPLLRKPFWHIAYIEKDVRRIIDAFLQIVSYHDTALYDRTRALFPELVAVDLKQHISARDPQKLPFTVTDDSVIVRCDVLDSLRVNSPEEYKKAIEAISALVIDKISTIDRIRVAREGIASLSAAIGISSAHKIPEIKTLLYEKKLAVVKEMDDETFAKNVPRNWVYHTSECYAAKMFADYILGRHRDIVKNRAESDAHEIPPVAAEGYPLTSITFHAAYLIRAKMKTRDLGQKPVTVEEIAKALGYDVSFVVQFITEHPEVVSEDMIILFNSDLDLRFHTRRKMLRYAISKSASVRGGNDVKSFLWRRLEILPETFEAWAAIDPELINIMKEKFPEYGKKIALHLIG